MRRTGIAVALAFLTASAPGWTAPRTARVVYATAGHLYLDAGTREGLVPGATLQLRRGGKGSACRVEFVSDTHAACAGSGRIGELVALRRSVPPRPAVERPSPPLSEAETARRRRVVETAPHAKVEYRAAAGPGIASGKTEVELAYASWASQDSGSWHQQRLDVAVRGAPVGAGFSLYADLSARHWSRRPGVANFRPDAATQLYVWEAELVRRPAQGGPQLALGRVRPWSMPGGTIIDGAQAGWRTSGDLEFGIFGGGVPDAVTLAPSFSRATAGTFVSVQSAGRGVVRWMREQVRLAWFGSPDDGRRIAVEGLSEISLAQVLDLSVDGRLSRGDFADASLDRVTLDAGLRPFERFSLAGGYRYQGRGVPELDGTAIGFGGAARHADLTANWDIEPWLTLSGTSGIAHDLTTGVTRDFLGPGVALPRLFGDVGGASFGLLGEFGDTPGHSAFVQVVTQRPRFLQVVFRASWFQTSSLGPYAADELSASTAINAQLGSALSLRIAALGRAGGVPGVRPLSGGAGSLLGGTFDAGLAGRF
ncbi:MAG: hypothetical protein ACJ79W_23325 [Myxococcales bacterium]